MGDKYNGWTNYETWNVKLWMDNEESSHRHYSAMAQEYYDDAEHSLRGGAIHWTKEENAISSLSAQLKEDYESAMSDMLEASGQSSSMWADLLGAALSEVNWHEIAESMIEDVDKDEENATADPSESEA